MMHRDGKKRRVVFTGWGDQTLPKKGCKEENGGGEGSFRQITTE